jgi:hypothetical protein
MVTGEFIGECNLNRRVRPEQETVSLMLRKHLINLAEVVTERERENL